MQEMKIVWLPLVHNVVAWLGIKWLQSPTQNPDCLPPPTLLDRCCSSRVQLLHNRPRLPGRDTRHSGWPFHSTESQFPSSDASMLTWPLEDVSNSSHNSLTMRWGSVVTGDFTKKQTPFPSIWSIHKICTDHCVDLKWKSGCSPCSDFD